MKRKRVDVVAKPLADIDAMLADLRKRLASLPDPLTTKQEKRQLIKMIKGMHELVEGQRLRTEQFIKTEEEYQRTLLIELKKEHINVRPTQGKALQTVVWSKGRLAKTPVVKPSAGIVGGGSK